jgi:hypothetical protein
MKLRLRKAERKFLANWSANMSATYTAAVLVTPNLVDLNTIKGVFTLILNIVYAILFAVFSIKLERRLQ